MEIVLHEDIRREPASLEMSGKDISSKKAKELAIFLRSWDLGIKSGLSLLIRDVSLHLVPDIDSGFSDTWCLKRDPVYSQ